jgi:hypothetical protein
MAKKGKPVSRHVVRMEDGRWAVKKPGAARASSVSHTQREAVAKARDTVRKQGGGEVRIHGRDGRIRDSDTIKPGRDPNPPKDRR